jgi:hypothetical protein
MKDAHVGPCLLCSKQGPLINSHILPAWSYRNVLENPRGGGPRVLVEGKVARLTHDQHKEPMLCADCEVEFSKSEGYVSRITTQPNGSFPAWTAAKFLDSRRSYDPKALCRRDASSMDCEKIGYFAASVLWRAAVARQNNFTLDLSEGHKSELQEYLLGRTGFPPSLRLTVDLIADGTDWPIDRMVLAPYTHGVLQEEGAEMAFHCFGILGLWFVFLSGDLNLLLEREPYDLMSGRVMLVNGFRPFFDESVGAGDRRQAEGCTGPRQASYPLRKARARRQGRKPMCVRLEENQASLFI